MSVLRWDICHSGFVLIPWKPNDIPCHIIYHHQMAATNEVGINALIDVTNLAIAKKL